MSRKKRLTPPAEITNKGMITIPVYQNTDKEEELKTESSDCCSIIRPLTPQEIGV